MADLLNKDKPPVSQGCPRSAHQHSNIDGVQACQSSRHHTLCFMWGMLQAGADDVCCKSDGVIVKACWAFAPDIPNEVEDDKEYALRSLGWIFPNS